MGCPCRRFARRSAFTKGRIIVRGKLVTRGKAKRADYILYYKPNIPIALIEAKDNNHAVGDGMQQALEYATTLDIPFVFSSNGDAFLFHDRTGKGGQTETELPLDCVPATRGSLDTGTATGKAWPRCKKKSSFRTTLKTVAVRNLATTSASPSIRPSKPSQRARTVSSLLWPQAPARPTPPFRSSGACGKPD